MHGDRRLLPPAGHDDDEAEAVALHVLIEAGGKILEVRGPDAVAQDIPAGLVAGAPILELIHPEDRDFFDAALSWALAGSRQAARLHVRLQQDGPAPEAVRARLTPHRPGVARIALSFEKTLLVRAAQAQLRQVLDDAPQGVLVRTAEGRILYVNPALAEMLGYAREEFLATENMTHHIHPEDRPLVTARAHARAANEAAPAQYEFRLLHRDGAVLSAETSAVHAIWDGMPVSISWITNITARKRAEEALRRSEGLFVKIFQESPDIVTLSTVTDGRYVDVNETFLRLSGRQRSDVIGRTSLELGIWSDPALRARLIEKLRREGTFLEVAALAVTPGGAARDYSVSGEIVQFEDQELLLVVSHDITEQRRQAELRWRSQKLEALGTLAGGIAHDLNNTLVPVLSLTKLTLKRLPEGSRERQNLSIVLEASERARDLVKQVVAFSRQEERAEKTVLDPAAVLQTATDMLRASIPATISMELRVEPVPRLLGDAGQIQQVVINLVTNAAQAIGGAMGTVTVALGTPSERPRGVASDGQDLNEWMCLSVSDTGCGMDEATQRRIFEPFFTTKGVGLGTGLGLSVVHGIVAAHGGHIELSSAPGKGSTFTLYFPALRATDATPATDAPAARPA
jgi:PAS domain S-box-containing protein